jgi:hypothetical protein
MLEMAFIASIRFCRVPLRRHVTGCRDLRTGTRLGQRESLTVRQRVVGKMCRWFFPGLIG